MRLTHLKLAGFKSFVDPTTLHIHGQRVGVVGPNGCGKSNVMESVRWVLGESSAKEMRADAMDAVIFNGSGNRKAISRASVELVFDNSLGGASGEWSQYAEISVKRVIERDKGSTYYINNTAVRRRDVADLFLGTGLGGRAYAIIGQNTISRIVEAKPEEMRVFLEEAAGITKYKERRRETELRLRDTRENLTRVEDILRELSNQILRLQSQAAVAEEYHRLQQALNLTVGHIWLLKKQDAGSSWDKAVRNVEKLVNELEAQMASLRNSETLLETARQQHVAATEQVNTAQAAYYEANATVSNLENQVKNTAEARERLQQQLLQLQSQLEKNSTQYAAISSQTQTAEVQLIDAQRAATEAENSVKSAQQGLNLANQDYQTALERFNTSQAAWHSAEQRVRVEQANVMHLSRNMDDTHELILRLQRNLADLHVPAESNLLEKEQNARQIELKIKDLEAMIAQIQSKESALQNDIHQARNNVQQWQKNLHLTQAEIASLAKIQQSMRNADDQNHLSDWLKQSDLKDKPRIWQGIRIKAGWETALESVLGNRLNAIVQDKTYPTVRPPTALAIARVAQNHIDHPTSSKSLTPLTALLEHVEVGYEAVLHEWLKGVYIAEHELDVAAQAMLNDGECLVNQQGDIHTRYSIVYYGSQSVLHGVLERQARLDQLHQELPEQEQELADATQQLQQVETTLQSLRADQHAQQQQFKILTQELHKTNLELQQVKQQQAAAIQRKTMLQADLSIAEQKMASLQQEKNLKEKSIQDTSVGLHQMQADKSAQEAHKNQAEQSLNLARTYLQQQERAHQEKLFDIKLIENNIKELNSKLEFLLEEKNSLNMRIRETETTLNATKMESLKANLEASLNLKQQRESALIEARNLLNTEQEKLLQQERLRMQNEQMLHPLRDKLEAARLNEQEARLHFELCQTELAKFDQDESALANSLQQMGIAHYKINQLEDKKNKLTADIEALGAVNLAAIEELATEQTRKQYLDSQCQDLTEASETLEEAIRKIDRETRSRLQATFDEANVHFNELFTTLFGGGQARLVLLGDEILDTGMQVFAQPPGKKNSTIHLLSGGEKALTALALVFALFRLNPAPFCLMDEVDAPLDDSNTERFCAMVKKMSERTQFLYVSHNKITMEMAQQLIGVTMQESGVSRIVDVDMEAAVKLVAA